MYNTLRYIITTNIKYPEVIVERPRRRLRGGGAACEVWEFILLSVSYPKYIHQQLL